MLCPPSIHDKSLDCVELKKELQEKVIKERAGLAGEQQIKRDEELIAKDPVLGPLWKKLTEKNQRKAG